MTPQRLAPLALVTGLLLAACGDDDTSAPEASEDGSGGGPVTVEIVDFDYDPQTLTVESGTEITFVNADETAHTATARDGSFNTDSVDGGSEATVTVEGSGEIAYFCAFHPFMEATVVVE